MAGRPLSEKQGRFPNRVRALRTKAGLTQQELADKLAMTNSPVAKLERGETRLHAPQIAKLAAIFHCHPIELILPLSADEREILRIVSSANAPLRAQMLDMLRVMAKHTSRRADKAA